MYSEGIQKRAGLDNYTYITAERAAELNRQEQSDYNATYHSTVGGNGGGGYGSSGVGNFGGGGGPAAAQMQQYTNQQIDPFAAHRADAGNQLAANGFGTTNDPSNFYANKLQQMSTGQFSPDDPSYQWRFQQGQQAVERSQAASGLLNSGNAAIELQKYGQGAASQEYGAEFSRLLSGLQGVGANYDAQQNRLMKMAGVGTDPGESAKLNLENNRNANDFNLGLYKSNQDNSLGRYQADLQAQTARMRNTGGGGGGGSIDQTNNSRYQDALSSSLFFNRPGGVSDNSGSLYRYSGSGGSY